MVPQAPSASAAVVLPDAVPGINLAGGLHSVFGNAALYVSLLHKFAGGYRGAAADIRASLARADWPAAGRLAHTTKGLAGTLGAAELQSAARTLEEAIARRQPEAALAAGVAAFETALGRVVEGIDAALPSAPAVAPASAVDWVRVRAVVDDLVALLDADDMRAVGLFEANASLLYGAIPAVAPAIAAALRDFDFAAARDRLAAARAVAGN